MGLFDIVGKVLGSGGSPPQNKPTSTLMAEQKNLLSQLNTMLGGSAAKGKVGSKKYIPATQGILGQPGQVYQGERVPGVTPLYGEAFQGASDINRQIQQYAGEGATALGQSTQAFDPSNIMAALQPSRDLAQQFFQNTVMPGVYGQAGAAGAARSSGASSILAREGGNLASQLGAQAAQPLIQGYENYQNRLFNAPNQYSALAGMLTGGNQGLLQAAGQQRGIAGEQLTAQQQRFMEADPWRNTALNYLSPALGTQAIENIVYPEVPSYYDKLLPLALGGMNMVGGK